MALSPQRQTISFIVRVWAEYLDADPPCWRGVIETVGGAEEFVFSELKQITEFIQQNTPPQNKMEDPK